MKALDILTEMLNLKKIARSSILRCLDLNKENRNFMKIYKNKHCLKRIELSIAELKEAIAELDEYLSNVSHSYI